MADQTLEARFASLRVIYFALVFSLGVYAFVAFQSAGRATPRELDSTFLYALIGVAVMEMIGIVFLRRTMQPPMLAPRSLDDKVALDGAAANTAFARYFTTSIITWALCESIAIYGLVLVFLSGDFRYYAPFAGVALLNFLFYRPAIEDVQAAVRAASHTATRS